MATPSAASSTQQAIAELKQRLGARANDSEALRGHHPPGAPTPRRGRPRGPHPRGESYHPPALPDVVCLPHTTEEVAEIVRLSARFGLPVVAFGAGTSLEGHVNAIHGGISIDLREMNRVVRVSVDDLDAT